MSESANIVLACRLIAAFSTGDEHEIEQLIHPAHREHAAPGCPRGADVVRQSLRLQRAGATRVSVTTEDIIASGDRVVVRVKVRDEARTRVHEQVHIWRVAEGRLAEHWMVSGGVGHSAP